MGPKVSIIIPTCDRPELLDRAVASVLDQDMDDWECIIVNDGGKYACSHKDSRIRHVFKEKRCGLPAAINSGLEIAAGRYVCVLGDDDWLAPSHFRILSTYLERHPSVPAAYTDAKRVWFDRNGREMKRETAFGWNFSRNRLEEGNYIPAISVMHRRELLNVIGLYDTNLERLEDWDMWLRISRMFGDFVRIPKTTAFIRWSTDGTTMSSVGRESGGIWEKTERRIREKHGLPSTAGCRKTASSVAPGFLDGIGLVVPMLWSKIVGRPTRRSCGIRRLWKRIARLLDRVSEKSRS